MLEEWINGLETRGEDPEGALAELRDLVLETPEEGLPALTGKLTENAYQTLVTVPLHLHEATEALVEVIDRLDPTPEQAKVLARRFPLSWGMCVWGGEPFDVRVLLNGVVLVRNHHRVLGPALWDGKIFDATPELLDALTADIATLRGRNGDDVPSCFLMTQTKDGPRLLGAAETADLAAPSWGQTIAVCALSPDDLKDGSPLVCEQLKEVGSDARSLVVFARFFGDRVDLIPASRYSDDLDIFLEEFSDIWLSESLDEGMFLDVSDNDSEIIRAIPNRTEHETEHLPRDGAGADWFRNHALPKLASSFAHTMRWSISNFGFGADPDGPRRVIDLPEEVKRSIGGDAELMRRSVTFQISPWRESARELVRSGELPERIRSGFEEVTGRRPDLVITGRVHDDLDEDPQKDLISADALPGAFEAAMGRVLAAAERHEYDVDDAALDADLGLTLLVDLGPDRPSDLSVAAVARDLSAELEGTVQVNLNGRGEYLAYADGEPDSGDHEMFRLDEDEDDEDD